MRSRTPAGRRVLEVSDRIGLSSAATMTLPRLASMRPTSPARHSPPRSATTAPGRARRRLRDASFASASPGPSEPVGRGSGLRPRRSPGRLRVGLGRGAPAVGREAEGNGTRTRHPEMMGMSSVAVHARAPRRPDGPRGDLEAVVERIAALYRSACRSSPARSGGQVTVRALAARGRLLLESPGDRPGAGAGRDRRCVRGDGVIGGGR